MDGAFAGYAAHLLRSPYIVFVEFFFLDGFDAEVAEVLDQVVVDDADVLLMYDPALSILPLSHHVLDCDPSKVFELLGYDGEIGFDPDFGFHENSPSTFFCPLKFVFTRRSLHPFAIGF